MDNLDANCTQELLKVYLLSNDVSVYVMKPNLGYAIQKKDKVTAFRVCVKAEHRTVVMDANLWSTGIIFRDWKFKGRN